LSIDKSGVTVVVGYDDSNIRIFNTKSLKQETIYKGHDDAILDILYDPNNKALVSCGADKTFRIWQ
jgi:WD40 repeat protein